MNSAKLIDDVISGLISEGWQLIANGPLMVYYTKNGKEILIIWNTNSWQNDAEQLITIKYSALVGNNYAAGRAHNYSRRRLKVGE